MPRVRRVDLGTLAAPVERANGSIVADAFLTRCGVFEYLQPDGSIQRELRLPEEVFKKEHLDSLSKQPLTDDHPPTMVDTKTARDVTRGATGDCVRDGDHVRSKIVVFDGDLIAKMKAGKREVSCGYDCDLELTPGEHPTYGKYDAIQRNLIGNHAAVVAAGRAGETVRARMDAAIMRRTDEAAVPTVDPDDEANRNARGENDDAAPEGDEPDGDEDQYDARADYDKGMRDGDDLTESDKQKMAAESFADPERKGLPINNPGHVRAAMARFGEYEGFPDANAKHAGFNRIVRRAKQFGISSDGFQKTWANKLDHVEQKDAATMKELARALEDARNQKERADAADAKAAKAEGELASVRKELEQARSDAEKARTDAADSLPTRVRERVQLETVANEILGATDRDGKRIDRAAMSERDIKIAVVKHVDREDIAADKPDAFVAAWFEGACKRARASASAMSSIRVDAIGNTGGQGQPVVVPAQHNDSDLTDENAARERMHARTAARAGANHIGATKGA